MCKLILLLLLLLLLCVHSYLDILMNQFHVVDFASNYLPKQPFLKVNFIQVV